MIHFRLRRFIRLVLGSVLDSVLDLLSLFPAGFSIVFRSAPLLLRGITASASTAFHPGAFPSLHLPPHPYSHSPATSSSKRRPDSVRSRYIASIGLLLAVSIEACGCNPIADSTLASDAFSDRQTGENVASLDQALSFYHPTEQTPPPSFSSLGLNDLSRSLRPIPAQAKSAPWAIPESVYFVYRGRRPGEPRQPESPLATAFVLAVPITDREGRDSNRLVRFLVTARHVVDPQWARCAGRSPASIDLRLNRRAGGVGYETVSLRTGTGPRFFTPSDPTADLAVIPLNNALIANLDEYKFLDVPFSLLLTASDVPLLNLEQPVMTAGLATLPTGEPPSFPVFSAGSLAKMPLEPVGVHCGEDPASQSSAKLLHIWFINASVRQGVSGSPVFATIPRGPYAAKTPVLLGIQSIVWPDRGMAGITPSPILGDLIRSALRQTSLHHKPD